MIFPDVGSTTHMDKGWEEPKAEHRPTPAFFPVARRHSAPAPGLQPLDSATCVLGLLKVLKSLAQTGLHHWLP